MENLNLHKQKMYALVLAGVALISLFLPWLTVSLGGFGGRSANGLRSWGLLSLLGVVAVIVASLMEDKTKPYMGNMKMIAMAGFGAVALGAIIWFIRISASKGGAYGNFGVKTGFGVYLAIIAGVLGLLWITGLVKMPESKSPNPPGA